VVVPGSPNLYIVGPVPIETLREVRAFRDKTEVDTPLCRNSLCVYAARVCVIAGQEMAAKEFDVSGRSIYPIRDGNQLFPRSVERGWGDSEITVLPVKGLFPFFIHGGRVARITARLAGE